MPPHAPSLPNVAALSPRTPAYRTPANRSFANRSFDRLGVIVSGLCLVHCLSGLVLVTMLGIGGLGIGGGLLANPAIHEIGLALAVLVGAVGLGLGVLRHRRFGLVALGGSGLVLMASALLVRHGPREAALTMLGVTLVAAAHVINMRRGHSG